MSRWPPPDGPVADRSDDRGRPDLLGYDRDFAAVDPDGRAPVAAATAAPGWRTVQLDGPLLRLPAGVRLDLGATAKGLGSDRAVRSAMAANRQQGGVLVSLGGDIAVDGQPPRDGWPILVAEEPGPAGPGRSQEVRLVTGAVATSSIACRQWRRAGRQMHHIVAEHPGAAVRVRSQALSQDPEDLHDPEGAANASLVAASVLQLGE